MSRYYETKNSPKAEGMYMTWKTSDIAEHKIDHALQKGV